MGSYDGPLKEIETEAYIVREANAPFILEKVILDEIRPDELLIRMKYTGICHTDIAMQKNQVGIGLFPAIFGHEGSGHILAMGSAVENKALSVGDAVLLSFNNCNKCRECKNGHLALCPGFTPYNLGGLRQEDKTSPGRLMDGTSVVSQFFGQSSLSRLSIVKERSVVKCEYPELMELYSPMGCGYQTGAGSIFNVLKPPPSSSIAIFGLGTVGLSALMAAKYLNIRQIIGIDIVDAKLELAKELGATDVLNSLTVPNKDILSAVRSLTANQDGPDFAVDCTGIVGVIKNVIEVVRPTGTAALVGAPPGGSKLEFDAVPFFAGNKRLIGIIEGDSNSQEFIPKLVAMHREGKFPVEKLSRLYPASKLTDAIQDMHDGKVVKPVLQWW